MGNKYTLEQYEQCNTKLIQALFSFQYGGFPFWTVLASKFKRVPVDDLKTIDVVVTMKGVELRYDPDIVLNAELGFLRYTLVHECLHLIYRHMFRFEYSKDVVDLAGSSADSPIDIKQAKQPIKAADLAADLVANRDLIAMFPDFDRYGVTKDDVPNFQFDLHNSSSEDVEAYIVDTYRQVTQSNQGQGGQGSGNEPADVNGKKVNKHAAGSTEAEGEMIKRIKQRMVEGMVSDTANSVSCKGQGSMPSELVEEIALIQRPPRKDWKALLAGYVKCSLPKASTKTWAHINRRVPYLIKGHKPKYIPLIGVAVDTSGSVSNKELCAFLEEIDHIRKIYDTDVELVQCDATIENTMVIKKKQPMPKEVTGRGGTEFYPALEYFAKAKRKPDVVVFFTDLCVSDNDVPTSPYNYNLIWVGTAEAQVEHFQKLGKYGKFIYMNPEEDE